MPLSEPGEAHAMPQRSHAHLHAVAALPQPYLLYLGDTTEPGYAKTAFGLRDWAPERCLGQGYCQGATGGTGLPAPRAAPSSHAPPRIGKLHGLTRPTTPSGSWRW